MQFLRQFAALVSPRSMLASAGVALLAAMVWLGGPLVALSGLQPLASVGVRLTLIALLVVLAIIWLVSGPFSLVGVASVCLLLWHAGPMLSLGSAQPLAAVWVRVSVIGAILFVYAFYWLYRAWHALRSSDDPLAKILSFGRKGERQEAATEELKTVASSVNRAIAQLKAMRTHGSVLRRMVEGKRYLYELPWYMVIGSPGAGKTTALRNSALRFPLAGQTRNAPRGLELGAGGGTMHCDWWLTNEAVLIDTAGRYTTQDSDAAKDLAEWHGFLGLLRKHRARAPINGALVALNAAELLTMTPTQRSAHAHMVRERLVELRQELGIAFPVYVVVTKMDLLRGFGEYFQSLNSEGRAQPWGFTFQFLEATVPRDAFSVRVGSELALLKARLAAGLRVRLNEEYDAERRRRLFALPQEFGGLSVPLMQVLEEVFLDSRFDGTQCDSALRGVYFTSAAQSGAEVLASSDTLLQRLRRSVHPVAPTNATDVGDAANEQAKLLPEDALRRVDAMPMRGQQGFFLRDLLAKVVFPEAHLVRPNLGWELRFRVLRLAGHALALVVFLWLAGGLAASFRSNRDYLAAVSVRAQALNQRVEALLAIFSPQGVPDVLTAAHDLPASAGVDVHSPPRDMQYGLSAVRPIADASARTYAQIQDRVLLPTILARIEAVLAESLKASDAGAAYDTLCVYKLLHDKGRYMKNDGAREVRNWVLKDWETTDSVAVFHGRASMIGHVQALFSGTRAVQTASLPNEALVRQAQAFLAGRAPTQRIYERAKSAMVAKAPPGFSLLRVIGPQASSLFSRGDGLPQTHGVPGLFTYDGYHDVVDKQLPEFVARALEEDAWVMGRGVIVTGVTGESPADLGHVPRPQADSMLREIRRLYLTEYATQWETFLDSIRAVSGSNTADGGLSVELSVLRQLAAPDSPLIRLARAVARETTLSRPLVVPGQADKGLLDKAADMLDKRTAVLGERLAVAADEPLEKQIVDDHFAALREVVTGQPDKALGETSGGARPGLEAISGLINEFYASLVVADTALSAGSPPPGGTDAGARLKLEAGKLPAPFREVLSGLAASGSAKVLQGATLILRKQAQIQLDRINGLLALQVTEPCRRGIAGRYPLAAVAQDASMEDFTAFFGAGGAIDEFFVHHLAPFVDTSVRPWRYKSSAMAAAMAGTDSLVNSASQEQAVVPAAAGPSTLAELLKLLAASGPELDTFYRARQIRDMFFREGGGTKLAWKADLRVAELDPSVTDLLIDIDGRSERYAHGPVQPFPINWPGPRGGAMAGLTANPRVSTATSSVVADGPWALFRLLDKGHLVGTATPGRMSVEYSFDGRKALLEISSGSQANPLNSDVLKGFQCPGHIA